MAPSKGLDVDWTPCWATRATPDLLPRRFLHARRLAFQNLPRRFGKCPSPTSKPTRTNLGKNLTKPGLKALAESIDALGIIQPITLRRVRASKFQIISGERRFRAAQMVGLDALPAYVREADDQTLLEMALVENIQREDLNPLEVALSYKRLMDDCGLTQQELGKRVGKARSSVTNHLRTLDLPMRIQHMLREGLLGLGHAKALAGLSGNDALYQQVALAEKALAEGASVRELESWVKALKSPGTASAKSQRERLAVREDETLALDRLRMKLSDTHAKLAIQRSPKGGGQITLKYQDLTDLESILNKLGLH